MTGVFEGKESLEKAEHLMKSLSFADPAHLHQLYKDWFNLVDIGDGYWYDIQESHKNTCWKSKMIFSIMCFFMLNVWVLSCTTEFKLWINFQKELAAEITK